MGFNPTFFHGREVSLPNLTERIRTTAEFLIGLSFATLHEADPLRFGVTFDAIERSKIRAGSAQSRATAITCQADIMM